MLLVILTAIAILGSLAVLWVSRDMRLTGVPEDRRRADLLRAYVLAAMALQTSVVAAYAWVVYL